MTFGVIITLLEVCTGGGVQAEMIKWFKICILSPKCDLYAKILVEKGRIKDTTIHPNLCLDA